MREATPGIQADTHHPDIPPEENNSVCRIVVSNIEALYQEILSIKALHPHLFVQMLSLLHTRSMEYRSHAPGC